MAEKKTLTIIVTALITALLVGGLVYMLMSLRAGRLETRVEELESANAQLRDQVAALQEELETAPDGNEEEFPEITLAPRPGWEQYFPTHETTTLLNEPVKQVHSLLGEPPVLLRSIAANPAANREIWIYLPEEEDPTGLYLFFKGNRLTASRLDEFNGLLNSGLLDDEDFWAN